MAKNLGFMPSEEDGTYFISYNSEDDERISGIVRTLHNAGLPLWYDLGITYHQEWQEQIANHIEKCTAVLMFVSRALFLKENSFVEQEYNIATKDFNKPVVPVLLDQISPGDVPNKMKFWWGSVLKHQCIPVDPASSDAQNARWIYEHLKKDPVVGAALPASWPDDGTVGLEQISAAETESQEQSGDERRILPFPDRWREEDDDAGIPDDREFADDEEYEERRLRGLLPAPLSSLADGVFAVAAGFFDSFREDQPALPETAEGDTPVCTFPDLRPALLIIALLTAFGVLLMYTGDYSAAMSSYDGYSGAFRYLSRHLLSVCAGFFVMLLLRLCRKRPDIFLKACRLGWIITGAGILSGWQLRRGFWSFGSLSVEASHLLVFWFLCLAAGHGRHSAAQERAEARGEIYTDDFGSAANIIILSLLTVVLLAFGQSAFLWGFVTVTVITVTVLSLYPYRLFQRLPWLFGTGVVLSFGASLVMTLMPGSETYQSVRLNAWLHPTEASGLVSYAQSYIAQVRSSVSLLGDGALSNRDFAVGMPAGLPPAAAALDLFGIVGGALLLAAFAYLSCWLYRLYRASRLYGRAGEVVLLRVVLVCFTIAWAISILCGFGLLPWAETVLPFVSYSQTDMILSFAFLGAVTGIRASMIQVKMQAENREESKNIRGLKSHVRLRKIASSAAFLAVSALIFLAAYHFAGPLTIAGRSVPRSLQALRLSDITLTGEDVKALAKMNGLDTLSLTGCSVEDAGFAVTDLSFENCVFPGNIFSGTVLPAESFAMRDCEWITDYTFLEQYPSLTSLTLIGAGLHNDNIPDLSGSRVTQYDVADNPALSDLSWISPHAKTLICSDCAFASLDFAASLEALETLVCDRCPLEPSETPLRSLYLRTLSLQQTGLSDLSILEGLTLLEDVNLSYNGITDISVLAQNSKTLAGLDVSGNPLDGSALAVLSSLGTLERLYVDDINLADLSFLAGLEGLRDFSAIHCGLTSIDGIEACGKLCRVRLSFNEIEDASLLAELPGLTEPADRSVYTCAIDLAGNGIKEIGSLIGMKTGTVCLVGNPLEITEEDTLLCNILVTDYFDGIEQLAEEANAEKSRLIVARTPLARQVPLKTAFNDILIFETVQDWLDWWEEQEGTSAFYDRYGGFSYSRWKELL